MEKGRLMSNEQTKSELWMDRQVLSAEESKDLARSFSRTLSAGDLVAFYGPLGSGKTFWIQAICREKGTLQEATSPSFTIINEYDTRSGLYLYHFDFYRLESYDELPNLGLDDYFFSDAICLIEWADKIQKFLPAERWEVHLDFGEEGDQSRKTRITRNG
jgi:tRNA threonylcarbamoyladenosine biosynthesis protein TsaE